MWIKIKAAFEAIKMVASIIESIKSMYDKYTERKIQKHYEKKHKVVDKINEEIKVELGKKKEEQNDEKLKDMHRRLTNISK